MACELGLGMHVNLNLFILFLFATVAALFMKEQSLINFTKTITCYATIIKIGKSSSLDKIATKLLLPLNSLEQRLEIPSTESREVVTLDNLDKNRWAVHEVLKSISLHPLVKR